MSLNTILATAPLTTTNYVIKATGTALGNSLIWDNGTNVGIGNTNTSYTLDVSGSLRSTTSAYFATTSGSVGIGTTIPSAKLFLAGDFGIDATSGVTSYKTSFIGGMYKSNSGGSGVFSSTNNLIIQGYTDGTAARDIDFVTGVTPSSRLYINTSGNVGIGTSSPLGSSTEKTLHLSDGGAGYTTLYVTNGANSLRGVFAVANSISSISIGTQSNHNLNIITNDTVKAIVTANGEFGVGVTPTSGNRFWVKGNDSTSANSTCLLQNSDGGIIMFARNDGPVTRPLQPAFRAGKNTSTNPGANSTIIFNYTGGYGFNIGGNYSTSTGRFTAPIAGRYIFTTCVIWQSVGNSQSMDDAFTIKVNGTTSAYSWRRATYISGTTGINGYYTDFGTFMLNLSASDYVEIVNRYDLTVHGNENYTWFAGYLL